MGTCRTLVVAFFLCSLFTLLFFTFYWEDVSSFRLHLLQDPKQKPLPSGCCSQSNAGCTQPTSNGHARTTVPTTARRKEEEMQEVEEERSSPLSPFDAEQEARKQRMMDVCSGESSFEFPGRTRSLAQIPDSELKNLLVDDVHKIIYCYIPKVACTSWKRALMFLSQAPISPSTGKPYTDPVDIPTKVVHNSSSWLTFDKFSYIYGSLAHHMMALKLQHYTKFLFVRDPFVRLISAFRNKFETPNKIFYKGYATMLLRRYGNVSGSLPATATEAHAAGLIPTFQNFIAYLVDPESEKKENVNGHWQQFYRLCHPCQIKYDFIGKIETLETDLEHLLKLLKLDDAQFPPGQQNITSASWVQEWFTQIPIQARRKLYSLYETDFRLFGYPKPDGLLDD